MELTQEIMESQKIILAGKSLLAINTISRTTEFSINQVTQNTINFGFKTLPGNKPNSYGNYVAIWQNSGNTIPWDTEPMKVKPITKASPSGDSFFDELDLDKYSYILGYSVGAELTATGAQKVGNICSTAYVPELEDEDPYPPFLPQLKMGYIGGNSVSVDYKLPAGLKPKSNGAWIGIWEAEQASYTTQPKAANTIMVDKSNGNAFINGITIGRGATYTIGLFMSGWAGAGKPQTLTAMACSITFTNPG
ncbi:MAG TPA: hypothetical protein VM802_24080 [Chitinophaga sp.]|uniref:hypothetical protein n=1 Tax=Chitinophaga sp. TaxID=1869181 RepID=UPI002CDCE3FE|nr:hypothetical protein [Chitinophaga sp.]HVI47968.1 hypothetical protein [Chitinophaga sp.]